MFLFFHNLLRTHFEYLHCFSGCLLTLLFTTKVLKVLFVFPNEYIFLNLIIQFHSGQTAISLSNWGLAYHNASINGCLDFENFVVVLF